MNDELAELQEQLVEIQREKSSFIKGNLGDINQVFGIISEAKNRISDGIAQLNNLQSSAIPQLQSFFLPESFEHEIYAPFRASINGYKEGLKKDQINRQKMINAKILRLLRTNISLPVCLRLIGHLRQQDELTSTTQNKLSVIFVQAREVLVNEMIVRNDPIKALNSSSEKAFELAIEIMGGPFLDVIIQYNALFTDLKPLAAFVLKRMTWFFDLIEEVVVRTMTISVLCSFWNKLVILNSSFAVYSCEYMDIVSHVLVRQGVEIACGKLDKAISLFLNSVSRITAVPDSASISSVPAFVLISNAIIELFVEASQFAVPQLNDVLRLGVLARLKPIEKCLDAGGAKTEKLLQIYHTELMPYIDVCLDKLRINDS